MTWLLPAIIVFLSFFLIIYSLTRKNEVIPVAVMITNIKCKKCGWEFKRPFVRGDFMMKELTEPNSEGWFERCKECDGTLYIKGIYLEISKTKKEIEFDEFIEKWR